MNKFFGIFFLVFFLSGHILAQETKRFALTVGVNDGGPGRVKLKYAVSDAKAVSRVFQDLGGISLGDVTVLEQPSASRLNDEIHKLTTKISKLKKKFSRIEVFFYYSGHSDDQGLLLGHEKYSYKDLKDQIQKIPADIKISILDSCASGAITRLKGGKKLSPFLLDSSMKMKGYAFITSSSHDEASQESDKIKGSYFTHYFLSGLRGAADLSQKGRVTLDESYKFAFYETLAQTEKSLNGAQHPGYEIKMAGSGDVVITDLRQASVIINFTEEIEGRISVRDENGNFVAELQKNKGKPVQLGVAAGKYEIIVHHHHKTYITQFLLQQDKKNITFHDLKPVFISDSSLRKGDSEEYVNIPFSFAVIPSISTGKADQQKVLHNISLNLLADYSDKLHGVALGGINIVQDDFRGMLEAYLWNKVNGTGKGFESAGIFNINQGYFEGIQFAGIFNQNGDNTTGAQIAGIMNLNFGHFTGFQASVINQTGSFKGSQTGVINIAGEAKGCQLGVLNITNKKANGAMLGVVNIAEDADFAFGVFNLIKSGRFDAVAWADQNHFYYAGIKTGVKYFYTLPFFGVSDQKAKTLGASLGSHILLFDLIFIEPEIMFQSFFNFTAKASAMLYSQDKIENDWGNWTVFKLSLGLKIKSFGVFAGLSLPLFYTNRFAVYDELKNFSGTYHDFKNWAVVHFGLQYFFF